MLVRKKVRNRFNAKKHRQKLKNYKKLLLFINRNFVSSMCLLVLFILLITVLLGETNVKSLMVFLDNF